jgi:RNA polymerase sigma-70 factor (ECF subfamily)
MQPPDEELVTAYLEDGDEQAFRRLVERHQDRIFGYLMGMVKDRAAANDIFQDTFVRVINAMQDPDGS